MPAFVAALVSKCAPPSDRGIALLSSIIVTLITNGKSPVSQRRDRKIAKAVKLGLSSVPVISSATRRETRRFGMRKLMLAVAVVFACGLLSGPALLQQKRGGEDETGPYEVVPNWPQQLARPGYALGSQGGVFAESPNRVILRQPR